MNFKRCETFNAFHATLISLLFFTKPLSWELFYA